MNNEKNVCGRCGAQFEGIKCPECGLVMCEDIIDDNNAKLKLLNTACNLLMDRDLIPKDVNFNEAIASFYYLLKSKDDGSTIGAFKIIANDHEFFFNLNNTLQYLKPEGKEMYESEFNKVVRLHKIKDAGSKKYKVPIEALKNYAEGECKQCHKFINPYDVVCSKCGHYFANDYPNYFNDLTTAVSFDNGDDYTVILSVPNNLDVVDDGKDSGHITLMHNEKPSFISFKIYGHGFIDNMNNLMEPKEDEWLGKKIKKGYLKFDNGDIIYTSEVSLKDGLYGKMEYQIGNAKSIDDYDESEFRKYLAILFNAKISKGSPNVVINNNTNSNDVSVKPLRTKKTKIGMIVGGLLLLALLIAGGVLLFGKKSDTMETYQFKDLTISIPSSYTEDEPILGKYLSTGGYGNDKCEVEFYKEVKADDFDYDTAQRTKVYYTKEEIYEKYSIEDEKTINGKTWYHRKINERRDEYYYINDDVLYRIVYDYDDKEYCKVDEILNSMKIK